MPILPRKLDGFVQIHVARSPHRSGCRFGDQIGKSDVQFPHQSTKSLTIKYLRQSYFALHNVLFREASEPVPHNIARNDCSRRRSSVRIKGSVV
jgi:hypothetical protein